MTLRGEFAHRGILRGGTLIMCPPDAIAMVERARELNVPVLGVDGFWITDETTQPDLEHTLDTGGNPADGWDEAAQFIAERADLGLMFEVVEDESRLLL
jgi:hypothetical protein